MKFITLISVFILPTLTCAGLLKNGLLQGLFQRRNIKENIAIQECALDASNDALSSSVCVVTNEAFLEDDEGTTLSESSYTQTVSSPDTPPTLGFDLGEVQVAEGEHRDAVLERIDSARIYFRDHVNVEEKYEKVRKTCRNKHSLCSFWAVLGECESNPAYMRTNCAPACQTCEMMHVETRCPLDPDAIDAFYPGDLNAMFERIITDPEYQQYEPVVLSRPSYAHGDGPNNATYKIGLWMVMFEKAVSHEEADKLIQLGGMEGYERSADVGDELEDGSHDNYINNGRTSTNAWCTGNCYQDPVARGVMDRIANITGIPEKNSENLQMLRYEKGQFYQTHNDLIPYQRNRPTGVRILTFYIYLNDVEEGGGTNFPRMDATVLPKKGRAVLWPSVYDQEPNTKDPRSDHQALPVIKGVKYGANAWIHQRDFKTPNDIGCS